MMHSTITSMLYIDEFQLYDTAYKIPYTVEYPLVVNFSNLYFTIEVKFDNINFC